MLFKDDIKKYPSACYDETTANTSFLRIADVLRKMGIQNYCFHLILLNPALRGVDPHSETLTTDQKIAINTEVHYNPWYYFREVARVPNGNNPLKFNLTRPSLALLWCFFCGIDFVLIMPRQIGKSMTGFFLIDWLINHYYSNATMFLFTKDPLLRHEAIEAIKKINILKPPYVSPQTKYDDNNTVSFSCKARGNRLITKIGQASVDDAEKVARGGTYPFALVDEGPYISNIDISLSSLLSAASTALDNYRNADMYCGVIYTTTAGDLDTKEGKYMYDFITSSFFWNECLFDTISKEEAREFVTINSASGRCMVNGTFSHLQAGKDNKWLRDRKLLTNSTRLMFEKDYLNKWQRGSSNSAIATHILEVIDSSEREPTFLTVNKNKYAFKWYIPRDDINLIMNSGYFGLGLDTSEAIGRDPMGLVLVNFKDLSTVAVSNIANANIIDYGLWIAELLIKFSRITLIIEKKSSAQAILDIIVPKLLAAGIDPFKRIYNRIVDNSKTRKEDYKLICSNLFQRDETMYLNFKNEFGFNTSNKSRYFLYNFVLNDAVKSVPHLVFDKTLSSELKGLVIKNDRVDHTEDGHDDLVIGWLLCHWFIKHALNLEHYGINRLECLTLVSPDGTNVSKEDLIRREQLNQLNSEIKNIKERLVHANSVLEKTRDEKILAYKVSLAKELGDTSLNMDSLLKDIEEERLSKRKIQKEILAINKKFNNYR